MIANCSLGMRNNHRNLACFSLKIIRTTHQEIITIPMLVTTSNRKGNNNNLMNNNNFNKSINSKIIIINNSNNYNSSINISRWYHGETMKAGALARKIQQIHYLNNFSLVLLIPLDTIILLHRKAPIHLKIQWICSLVNNHNLRIMYLHIPLIAYLKRLI